jgi:hypothetical protein
MSAFAIYMLLAIGLNITGNVMRNAPATPASTVTPADGTTTPAPADATTAPATTPAPVEGTTPPATEPAPAPAAPSTGG